MSVAWQWSAAGNAAAGGRTESADRITDRITDTRVDPVRIYIGIGSNIDPERQLTRALGALHDELEGMIVAPWYRSASVGFEGPAFVNTVCSGSTRLSPSTLIERLRQQEDRQGRDRSLPRFSSRPLDLDLLLYGSLVQRHPDWQLPRPDLVDEPFTLQPLADIAADLVLPDSGMTVEAAWVRQRRRQPDVYASLQCIRPAEPAPGLD